MFEGEAGEQGINALFGKEIEFQLVFMDAYGFLGTAAIVMDAGNRGKEMAAWLEHSIALFHQRRGSHVQDREEAQNGVHRVREQGKGFVRLDEEGGAISGEREHAF